MNLKDPNALEHLTLDSVVNDAINASIEDNRIILIKNGAESQINIILKSLIYKFKEKYPLDAICVLDGDKDRNIINQVYDLALGSNGCYINIHYIIFDYFNFIKRDRRHELDYLIDVKGCFGHTIPQ